MVKYKDLNCSMNQTNKNKENQTADYGRVYLAWNAPEIHPHNRGQLWYLLCAIVLVLVVLYSAYTGSYLTGVVFILLSGVYLMNERVEIRTIDTEITDLGIRFGMKFYQWSDIEGFWIFHKPNASSSLHLKLFNVRTDVIIQLSGVSPSIVREVVSKELPETEGKKEDFVHMLIRIFKL